MIGIPHRYLTERYPGIGGGIKENLEDFIVEEVPLYCPLDHGEHTYFEIEKVDLSTLEAVERIASALGIPSSDIGFAGLKDRKGITRQVLSVPHLEPSRVLALRLSQMRVHWARLHVNKLKVGHLRGNRFRIRVRGVAGTEWARRSLRHILDCIARAGMPNFYGPQRFGLRGDSFRVGLALIQRDNPRAVRRILGFPSTTEQNLQVVLARHRYMRGDLHGALQAFPPSYRLERRMLYYLIQSKGNHRGAIQRVPPQVKRIYFSALQSFAFNRILDRRLELSGALPGRLFPGDLAFLHRNGACFKVADPAREQPRADGFEISPSGPIFGKLMPAPGGLQSELEAEVFAPLGIRPTDFHQLLPRLHMRGGRRPLRVEVRELRWEWTGDSIYFEFFLPKGAYATTLLREVIKGDEPASAFYSDCEEAVPVPDEAAMLAAAFLPGPQTLLASEGNGELEAAKVLEAAPDGAAGGEGLLEED
jgi:tRNA pseudouridine13 synthase